MKAISATQARQDIYNLVESVEQNNEPVYITSKRANAVLISESDWRAISETLYLNSIPGMVESIKQAWDEPDSECTEDPDW